jgi:hypothetical protein
VPGEKKYFPDGYRIHELGPSELVGKGDVEMNKTREELRTRRTGCVLSHCSTDKIGPTYKAEGFTELFRS